MNEKDIASDILSEYVWGDEGNPNEAFYRQNIIRAMIAFKNAWVGANTANTLIAENQATSQRLFGIIEKMIEKEEKLTNEKE